VTLDGMSSPCSIMWRGLWPRCSVPMPWQVRRSGRVGGWVGCTQGKEGRRKREGGREGVHRERGKERGRWRQCPAGMPWQVGGAAGRKGGGGQGHAAVLEACCLPWMSLQPNQCSLALHTLADHPTILTPACCPCLTHPTPCTNCLRWQATCASSACCGPSNMWRRCLSSAGRASTARSAGSTRCAPRRRSTAWAWTALTWCHLCCGPSMRAARKWRVSSLLSSIILCLRWWSQIGPS
jgi:hypothetical protein